MIANTHQGHFPDQDTDEDGYLGFAPVAQYADVSMTWQATFGSAQAIAIAPATTPNSRWGLYRTRSEGTQFIL